MQPRHPAASLKGMDIPDQRAADQTGSGVIGSTTATPSEPPAVLILTMLLLLVEGGLVFLATLEWFGIFSIPGAWLFATPQFGSAAVTLLLGGTVVGLHVAGAARIRRWHGAWWVAMAGVAMLAGAILFVLLRYEVSSFVPETSQAFGDWTESPGGLLLVDVARLVAALGLPCLSVTLLLRPAVRHAARR
jgi:hypothetical protein